MTQASDCPIDLNATADPAATRSAENSGKPDSLPHPIVLQSTTIVALIACLRNFARRGRELRDASATVEANSVANGTDTSEWQPND